MIVYNTLSRSYEEFVPLHDNEVKMYVCGQTVYDDAHLGHAKNYIDFSIIVRWLRYLGYKVTYVQNITDVDDKIIARAHERGMEPIELARYYERRFLEDMEKLNIKKDVDLYPRSHDYIDAIRDQIQILVDKGYAYYLDGDIYFNVAKFEDYTKLSGMKLEELNKHRIEPKEGKINTYDFSLWKAAKPNEPFWEITIRFNNEEKKLRGRPGWHIEDTAMTYSIFGPQYDIHGGATELIFPHHTNEIAQAEAAYGVKPFVKYWLHTGILKIKGEKMSKSLKNFITIREFLEKYDPEVLKIMVASSHYRSEIDYQESLVENSKKKLEYIYNSFSLLYNAREKETSKKDLVKEEIKKFSNAFKEAMNYDFNTPEALKILISFLSYIRSYIQDNGGIEKEIKGEAISFVKNYSNILGILEREDLYKKELSNEIYNLIEEREELRKLGKYEEADKIRERLKKEFNIIIEDTEYGPIWYFSKEI